MVTDYIIDCINGSVKMTTECMMVGGIIIIMCICRLGGSVAMVTDYIIEQCQCCQDLECPGQVLQYPGCLEQ